MNKATPTSEIIGSLMNTEKPLDRKMKDSRLQLVEGSKVPLIGAELDERRRRRRVTFEEDESGVESDCDIDEDSEGEESGGELYEMDRSKVESDCEESDAEGSDGEESDGGGSDDGGSVEGSDGEGSDAEESDGEGSEEDEDGDTGGISLRWKENLTQKATAYFTNRRKASLQKLVYDNEPEKGRGGGGEEEKEELGGLFQTRKTSNNLHNHQQDTSLIGLHITCDWSSDEGLSIAKDYFVTGSWGDLDAAALLDEDEELYGDFEDYETGLKQCSEEKEEEEEEEEERERKKKELKKAFDAQYDNKDDEVMYMYI